MSYIDRLFGFDKKEAQLRKELSKEIRTETAKQTKKVSKAIITHLDKSMTKSELDGVDAKGIKRYQVDLTGENKVYSKTKPGASVSFDVLREFSITHEVSRACINCRKRQITALDWDIVPAEKDDKNDYSKDIIFVKGFFKNIGGRTKFRSFQNKAIEDVLTLDALALYKQKRLNGELMSLINVDGATIRLRVDQAGNTPEPPEIAYKQVIRGKVLAELTADEMYYEMMNPRSNSPYGLAPLESLLVVVSSSLKAGLHNLSYLTEGNIPEGFFGVPKDWTPQMIKDFQENWDAVMAGDESATRKLRFTPEGSYTATKKPSDMAWESFNEWLLKVTCALFDVQPQEIGFLPKQGLGGKGFSEEQNIITDRKSVKPLANFFTEIWDDVIQNDLGFPYLKFKYLGLETKDEKAHAETNEVLIRSGQRTVDELRSEDGLDPVGVNKPFIIGNPTFIDEESLTQKQKNAEAMAQAVNQPNTQPEENPTGEEDPNTQKRHEEIIDEFKKFRKMSIRLIKDGKYREFQPEFIPEMVASEINKQLKKCKDVSEAKEIFKTAMSNENIEHIAHNHIEKKINQNDPFLSFVKTDDYKGFQSDIRKGIKKQADWVAKFVKANPDMMTSKMGSMIENEMPKMSEYVDLEKTQNYFKKAFTAGVKAQYQRWGIMVKAADEYDFEITNEFYIGMLNNQANYLLNLSKIDNTTRDKLIDIIKSGNEDGLTIDEIAGDITKEFDDISDYRATMIANTETNRAMSTGQLASMKENGIATKSWVTAGANVCEVCQDNEDDGEIDVNKAFSSGDDAPAAHPNCECYLDGGQIDLDSISLWEGE